MCLLTQITSRFTPPNRLPGEGARRLSSRRRFSTMNTYTRHAIVPTPVGNLTLVASGDALAGLYFARHWPRPDDPTSAARAPANPMHCSPGGPPSWTTTLPVSERRSSCPITTHGDLFQERVWSLLREIPIRRNRHLWRTGPAVRGSLPGPRNRSGGRAEPTLNRRPLPPGYRERRNPRGLRRRA